MFLTLKTARPTTKSIPSSSWQATTACSKKKQMSRWFFVAHIFRAFSLTGSLEPQSHLLLLTKTKCGCQALTLDGQELTADCWAPAWVWKEENWFCKMATELFSADRELQSCTHTELNSADTIGNRAAHSVQRKHLAAEFAKLRLICTCLVLLPVSSNQDGEMGARLKQMHFWANIADISKTIDG